MTTAFRLDVRPGKAAGPFALGAPLPEVVQLMRKEGMAFRRAELLFAAPRSRGGHAPLEPQPAHDTLLLAGSLRLRFSAVSQRLKAVEVRCPAAGLALEYLGTALPGDASLAAVVSAMSSTGLRRPGSLARDGRSYALLYPGVAFVFAVPERAVAAAKAWGRRARHRGDGDGDGGDRSGDAALPPGLEADRSFRLSRVLIFCGRAPEWPPAEPPALPGDPYFERVDVRPGRGVAFARRGAEVTFASTAQDVLADLGAPDKVFVRADTRATHAHHLPPHAVAAAAGSPSLGGDDSDASTASVSPSLRALRTPPQRGVAKRPPRAEDRAAQRRREEAAAAASAPDYFYNYFALGVDVLFDGVSHRARKIVLHANAPSSPDFHRYHRCAYHLPAGPRRVPEAGREVGGGGRSPLLMTASTSSAVAGGDGGAGEAPDAAAIGPATRWDDVRRMLGDPGQPLVASPPGAAAARYYAYPGALFHVTHSGEVATVTLCEPGDDWDASWWP